MNQMRRNYFLITSIILFLAACNPVSKQSETGGSVNEVSIQSRVPKAVIYEVNIRQDTPEGTLNAFTSEHLARLKKLGVDILWLMPVYPISVKNRKGTLGSYYSIADYEKVNPEFGNLQDLKNLVNKAHQMGMYVILDWVANHTGWDNWWIEKHPDWYTHNKEGKIISPVADWSDVADLNYDNLQMRAAMIDAMKYWIKEADIDGYRCDAAAMVPVDFWDEARAAIDSVKPVFMLAEAWEPDLMKKAFDAGYNWDLLHTMNDIAKGKKNATALDSLIAKDDTLYQKDDILMNFITNHDENTWSGTAFDRLDGGVKTFAVLTYMMPGMPLIYSGQEASMKKRLRFFEKDTVNWSDTTLYPFYRKLDMLKHDNPALKAGITAGSLTRIETDNVNVFAFSREKGKDRLLAIFNLSSQPASVTLGAGELKGKYTDVFSGENYKLTSKTKMELAPWQYLVLK